MDWSLTVNTNERVVNAARGIVEGEDGKPSHNTSPFFFFSFFVSGKTSLYMSIKAGEKSEALTSYLGTIACVFSWCVQAWEYNTEQEVANSLLT